MIAMKTDCEKWSQPEIDLFDEALKLSDPVQRVDFLNRACAGRPVLRVRLEELLALHAEAERFFAQPADHFAFPPTP